MMNCPVDRNLRTPIILAPNSKTVAQSLACGHAALCSSALAAALVPLPSLWSPVASPCPPPSALGPSPGHRFQLQVQITDLQSLHLTFAIVFKFSFTLAVSKMGHCFIYDRSCEVSFFVSRESVLVGTHFSMWNSKQNLDLL